MDKSFAIGRTINNSYKIISSIGKGGIGRTYLAEEIKTKKEVVLKVLNINKLDEWKILELFEREVKVLKSIDHPNIPDYFGHFKINLNNEMFYVLVQEYAQGKNIYEQIKSGQQFSVEEIKRIMRSLLKTLSYIHSLKPQLVHRDINPKNIIIDKGTKVFLVDFGAVGYTEKNTLAAAKSDTFVGTIGYMPPEQLYGKITPATDLYSLGMTIIFMLSGKEPFELGFKNLKIDYNTHIKLPEDLKIVLDIMLEPDIDSRIDNADTILGLLDGTLERPVENKEPAFENLSKKLLEAVLNNNTELVKELIEHGADVNGFYKGRAVLNSAVISGKIKHVKLLLDYGAKVNIKDSNGKQAIEYAYKHNHKRIITLLLKYGAKDIVPEEKTNSHINLGSPPRRLGLKEKCLIRKESTGNSFGLGLFIALQGLLFVYLFVISARLIPSFALAGVDASTQGLVINVESTSSSVNDTPVYKNTFRFMVDNEIEYIQYSFTSGYIYSPGDRVTINYVSSNPNFSVIAGARYSVFGIFVIFVIIAPIAGFFMLIKNWPRNFGKYIRLLKYGKLSTGKIVYRKKKGNKYQYFYKYRDDNNKARIGTYTIKKPDFGDTGKKVHILYISGIRECSELIDSAITYKNGIWQLGLNKKDLKMGIIYWTLSYVPWIGLLFSVLMILKDMGIIFPL